MHREAEIFLSKILDSRDRLSGQTMKEGENLVLKLDLLESLLRGEDASPRLGVTKLASEKIAKKWESKPRSELAAEVKQLKQTVVERKIHHGEVQVQRALKSAVKVEPLKIRKRIKKLEDDNKKKQLEEELSAVAALNPADTAKKMVYRSILKSFLGKHQREDPPEFLSTSVQRTALEHEPMDSMSLADKNVFARLMNVDGIKKSLQDMIKTIKVVTGLESKHKETTDNTESLADKPTGDRSEIKAQEDDASDMDGMEDSRVAGSDESEAEDDDEQDSRLQDNKRPQPEDSDGDASEDEDFFETNLPKLASGYYSGGSDEEDDYDYEKDAKVLEVTTERKNRRGQRARRKIWEMKYGKNANHVKKEREERIAKAKKRQAEFEERQAKRQRRQQERESRQAHVPAPEPEKPKADPDKPLHPSWEARLKQKEAKFQGKKVVFD